MRPYRPSTFGPGSGDEPDVGTPAREIGLSYLFISHDLAVVERIAHRVAVMYLGQIVELGSREQIFRDPRHSYTKRLPKCGTNRRPPTAHRTDAAHW
ncbi:MAG: hypothetical protein Ct9H300mP12_15840 [Acidimicrobiales bacterium]|nr:MAG: hypothetical protein Ct9H300mP12_15840 [Acidimicrobiales bacterium]